MLRDALTAVPGFATWPCDELNGMWRHGNAAWPDDALPAALATAPVARFIRHRFERFWRRSGRPPFVVEKTCANTLRVPFVDAVLPEAVFIHICRPGPDVAASAARRWRGGFEGALLPYLVAKARHTPPADLPRNLANFLRSRVRRLNATDPRLPWWGPRVPGIEALPDTPLEDICTRQWAACVTAARAALAQLHPQRRIDTSYDALCSEPEAELGRLLHFLGVPPAERVVRIAAAGIRPMARTPQLQPGAVAHA